MNHLDICIEINGEQVPVGRITHKNLQEVSFVYDRDYLENVNAVPISVSLPLEKRQFTASETRTFFEGLLPEGFTRRSVAAWMHTVEEDYLTILAGLGKECLGAVQITDDEAAMIPASYQRLDEAQVDALAKEGATKSAQLVVKSHLSLTGATGKVGLYYDAPNHIWYQPHGDAPSTYIVKQSHIRLDAIVTNEQLCLLTAKNLGIETPESFIVNLNGSKEGDVLFATRRYDRLIDDNCHQLNGLPRPYRLHQEDFSQALGIDAADKYEPQGGQYLKKAFDLIKNYSADPVADQKKLWDIFVFDYLIGNADNHLKNISILYSRDLKSLRLAPAYDIVSTSIYENSTREMAMRIGGDLTLDAINRESFLRAAEELGLGKRMAMKRFDRQASLFEKTLEEAAFYLESQGFTKAKSLRERILQSSGYRNLL